MIDELDRIKNRDVTALLTDTIKTLSDNSLNVTVILVGVADTVNQLIAEHQSVERSLVQIAMPRMSMLELFEIVDKALLQVGVTIDADARKYIAYLSQGLPHYTHLLGLYAAYASIDEERKNITKSDVEQAIANAVDKAQASIRSIYHTAVSSARKTLYEEVLAACALAPTDELGYFAAGDVREPMSRIMQRPYDIPAFARHLNDFCEERRGAVLQKTGTARRYRFRFKNPLMQPFVVMKGLAKGLIRDDVIEA